MFPRNFYLIEWISHPPKISESKCISCLLGNEKHKKNALGKPHHIYGLKIHGNHQTAGQECVLFGCITYFSSPVLLGCPIKGYPTPNITWFHSGRPIANVTGLMHHILAAGQILQIANLSGGSQGEFSCLAQNEAGMLVQKASLVIQGKKPFRHWVPGLLPEQDNLLGII